MSTLFRVKVASKQKRTVELDVKSVHPDSGPVYQDISYALLMIWEATTSSPIRSELTLQDILDEGLMANTAAGYVTAVKVTNKQKKTGRLVVTVSDEAWISHLAKGAAWDSTAFPVARTIKPHAPIRPGGEHDELPAVDGFLMVSAEIFAPVAHRGEFVPLPKFGPKAYRVAKTVRAPSPSVLETFIGKAVRIGTSDGIYLDNDLGEKWIYRSDGSASGVFSVPELGLIEMNPKGKRGTELTYQALINSREIESVVTAVAIKGRTATLDIELDPLGSVPVLTNKAMVFAQLLAPFGDFFTRRRALAKAPLGLSVAAECKARQDGNVIPNEMSFAGGYIESFTWSKPKRQTAKIKTEKQYRAAFAKPRRTAKLVVTVTDAKWLDHLKQAVPFAVASGWHDEEPWTEPPITSKKRSAKQ